MKAILGVLVLALAVLSTAVYAQDSLGDIARQQRAARKQSANVFTNENLPHADVASNGAATVPGFSDKSAGDQSAAPSEKAVATQQGGDNSAQKQATTEQPAGEASTDDAERERTQQELQTRYEEEKKTLHTLDRELNVLQSEYRIQLAEYYNDAGTRLRNDNQWAQNQRQYERDIAAKQKELQEAQQKLDSTKDDARRSGMPPRMFEQ